MSTTPEEEGTGGMRDVARMQAVKSVNSNQNAPSLSPDQAKAILQFLQRTQMQGAEMPVYVDLFNTLSAIAAPVMQQHQPPG